MPSLSPRARRAPLSLLPLALVVASAAAQDLVIQAGHRAGVTCAAVLADGQRCATAGRDGRILLWDLATGRLIRAFECDHRLVGMQLSADGRMLAGGGINSAAVLVDLHRGRTLLARRLFEQGGYCGASIRADATVFAAGGDRNVGVYRVAGGERLHHFAGPQKDRFHDVAFSPDGEHLAVASDERTVYVLRLPAGTSAGDAAADPELREQRRLTAGGVVLRVVFHPDGAHLLGLVQEGAVRVWQWRSGEPARTLAAPPRGARIVGMALAADGSAVAVGHDSGRVAVHDFATGRPRTEFAAHDTAVTALAFHPDGARLLTGSDRGRVRLWAWSEGRRLRDYGRREMDRPSAVAMAAARADRGRVPVALWDPEHGALRVWDLRTKETLWTAPAGSVRTGEPRVAFSPDATHVALGRRGGPVGVWEIATGRRAPRWVAGVPTTGAFALGPGGRRLAMRVTDDEVALWRHDLAEPERTLPGRRYYDVLSMAFSFDGQRLAQAGKGNSVQALDVATGERIAARADGPGWIFGLAWSRDGGRLLCGGPYSALTLRGLPDLDVVRAMRGRHRGSIGSVAVSDDGERLVSVGGEGTVVVSDASTGAELLRLHALADGEWFLATPDGRWQASPRASDWCAWTIADPDRGLQLAPLATRGEGRSADLVRETLGGR